MATYNSPQIANRRPTPGFGAGGGQVRTAYSGLVALPAALAIADLIPLFYLPANARVVGGQVKVTDLDTGTTATLDIGDVGNGINAVDRDRYFAAITLAQTGGVSRVMAATGVGFSVGAQPMLVQGQLAAGPTTTAGTLEVWIDFTVEEPQG